MSSPAMNNQPINAHADGELVSLNKTIRLFDNEFRNYKWKELEERSIQYQDIINFKRSSNPRGVGHHCVMCGDKNAAIPSQNKDVCKACDTGFWLVNAIQVVVKFCKGCKNFARLLDFKDKPEATKCIKCRLRGKHNYFSKRMGGGDDLSLESIHTQDIFETAHARAITAPSSAQGSRSSSRPRSRSQTENYLSHNYQDFEYEYIGMPKSSRRNSSNLALSRIINDYSISSRSRELGARTRSATLDGSDLTSLRYSSEFYGDVSASRIPPLSLTMNTQDREEVDNAAKMLLAASVDSQSNSDALFYSAMQHSTGGLSREHMVRGHWMPAVEADVGIEKISPRAALLSAAKLFPLVASQAAAISTEDVNVLASLKTSSPSPATGQNTRINVLTQSNLEDAGENHTALLQLAEWSEQMLLGSSSLGEGRLRSNTLDLGSLGTSERTSSLLHRSEEATCIDDMKVYSKLNIKNKFRFGAVPTLSSTVSNKSLKNIDILMSKRANQVRQAAQAFTQMESELVKVESLGDSIPIVNNAEFATARRVRSVSLGGDFSMRPLRYRSFSESEPIVENPMEDSMNTESFLNEDSLDKDTNDLNSRKRSTSATTPLSPTAVPAAKRSLGPGQHSFNFTIPKSQTHMITPSLSELNRIGEMHAELPSIARKRLCSRSDEEVGDNVSS